MLLRAHTETDEIDVQHRFTRQKRTITSQCYMYPPADVKQVSIEDNWSESRACLAYTDASKKARVLRLAGFFQQQFKKRSALCDASPQVTPKRRQTSGSSKDTQTQYPNTRPIGSRSAQHLPKWWTPLMCAVVYVLKEALSLAALIVLNTGVFLSQGQRLFSRFCGAGPLIMEIACNMTCGVVGAAPLFDVGSLSTLCCSKLEIA
eukprot:6177941-Amphidinium_carterae.1